MALRNRRESACQAHDLLVNVLFWMIFGTGMGLLDYYPGTGIGALGDRSRHALHGVVGVLACATLYEEAYP